MVRQKVSQDPLLQTAVNIAFSLPPETLYKHCNVYFIPYDSLRLSVPMLQLIWIREHPVSAHCGGNSRYGNGVIMMLVIAIYSATVQLHKHISCSSADERTAHQHVWPKFRITFVFLLLYGIWHTKENLKLANAAFLLSISLLCGLAGGIRPGQTDNGSAHGGGFMYSYSRGS